MNLAILKCQYYSQQGGSPDGRSWGATPCWPSTRRSAGSAVSVFEHGYKNRNPLYYRYHIMSRHMGPCTFCPQLSKMGVAHQPRDPMMFEQALSGTICAVHPKVCES